MIARINFEKSLAPYLVITTSNMKKVILNLKFLLALGIFMLSIGLKAQPSKVEEVRMVLEDADPNAVKDIRVCKRLIDAALEHPKTANDPKMWVYRAAVYFEISRKLDDLNKETPDAIRVAADALFKCSETDLKGKWKEQFDFYLLNIANVLFNAAVSDYQAKNYERALDYYQITLRLIPLDPKGDLKTINISEDLVYQYTYYAAMAKGDNALTKTYINKLIAHKFNDPKIYSAKAKICLDEADTAMALSTLDEGRAIFKEDKDLLFMKIDIFIKQGQTAKLLTELNTAIALDEQNAILYFARATTYEKIGKLDSAELDYKASIIHNPEYYDAFFNLGVFQVNKARPLIEQLQKTYKKMEQDALEQKIKLEYKHALEFFERCWEIGVPNKDKKESYDLIESMQRLYKNTDNAAKEAEMKALKETIFSN